MNGLNDREQAFVDSLKEYQTPMVTNLRSVDKNDPNRKELLDSFREGAKGTENIITALGGAVNNYSSNVQGMVNEIKQDNNAYTNLVQLAYEWVELWNNAPEYSTDPRNVHSTKLCKQMANALIEHDGYITEQKCFVKLDEAVKSMHKTLVQSATNLFATVLKEENRSIKSLLDEKYGNKDVSLPII